MNCLHSYGTENKLKSHRNVFENKDICNILISIEETKILKFNQFQKIGKAPFIIYAGFECLIENTDGCKYNPEKSSTTKVAKHISSGF